MGAASPVRFVRFGSFQLDLRAGELRRNGIKVRVPDQSIQVLTMLVEDPGEVVTREELHEKLWPNGTIVEFDRSINAAIKRLRQALEDSPEEPKFIETLPKRGYRFLVSVERVSGEEPVAASAPEPATSEPMGQRISHYRVVRKLGQGAMGVVYLAEDTRLGRSVALKFLPEELADDPQSLERFKREARAASTLNHPHICALYDIGNQDGIDYLVMEYLEGETLAHRLRKGPLPLDETLRYAIEITDALDTAHRHGVIHRDLKPGNIMLTKAGAKLLDFGLAKVRATEAVAGMSAVPTQTTPLTEEGTILGTMLYMAPEQLEGREADARTDLFALGTVLYEMTTGCRAFEGESHASLIAAILEREPLPISTLQPMVTPALDHVICTCLAKDPEARWQTAHDVLVDLKWIREAGLQPGIVAPVVTPGKIRERIVLAVVVVLSIALGALAAVLFRQHPAESHAVRLQFPLPDKMKMDWFDFPVISPDGQRVLLPGIAADGSRHLWLHSLDSLADQLLPGTEEAYQPFWSPDSGSIAFFTPTKLKRMNAAGGPAQTICNVGGSNPGGTWNRDGVILFSGTNGSGIFRISAAGGEPEPVIQLDKSRQETEQSFPQFLPDGRHFLYLSQGSAKHDLYVGSLDAKDALVLIPNGSATTPVPPGFLIYGSQETLLARRFDAGMLHLTGEAVPIAEHVGRMTVEPASLESVSQNGVLVYSGGLRPIQLAWHNREGTRQAAIGEPGTYGQVDLSPDERRLAVRRYKAAIAAAEIWILEISTGILSRLTSQASDEPHWSPDSDEILFSSNEKGKYDVYRKAVGGNDQTLVFHADQDAYAQQWLPDGTVLVEAPTLYRVSLTGQQKPVTLLKADSYPGSPKVSTDGRWVAYYSDESGQNEVYVAAFPSLKEKRQVSNGGGCQPHWRKDGKELFYLSLDGKMMSVAVRGDTAETSAPKALFRISLQVDTNSSQYAVSKDGMRFLFGEPLDAGTSSITVVLNWAAGLKP